MITVQLQTFPETSYSFRSLSLPLSSPPLGPQYDVVVVQEIQLAVQQAVLTNEKWFTHLWLSF